MSEEQKTKSARGFASMDPERQREIARMGGRAVPSQQRSFARNKDLAREAGRRGGLATPASKRTFSYDSQHAAEAGRKGGLARTTPTQE
ncbi:MAG: general stress protein [Beijerinckiaceae bacterium]